MPARKLPRPFSLHWGSGQIVEEATVETQHSVPTIQLLEFSDGVAQGSIAVRFCFYDHRGRFQRDPLILGADEIVLLRDEIAKTPRLREFLRALVAE